MKKKYGILLFFPIVVVVSLGLEYAGQAMGLLPQRTLTSNLVETVIVGVVATIFFVMWARRRQKSSTE
jgi:hypothetical protein